MGLGCGVGKCIISLKVLTNGKEQGSVSVSVFYADVLATFIT